MDPQTTTLILAGMTAIATIAAAVTAIVGPKRTARYALELQQEKESADRKFSVFLILMTHRRNYGQPLVVQHLNIIDVLWRDNRTVKDRWAEFFESLNGPRGYSMTQQEERFKRLLQAIADDLKLGSDFSSDDYQRVYYSNALSWQEQAESIRNQAVLAAADQLARENQVVASRPHEPEQQPG